MSKILKISAILLLVSGCSTAPKQEFEQPLQQPEISSPKDIPSSATEDWIRGYRDAYSGNWLAPAQWLAGKGGEYRAGWNAGERDKEEGLPPRAE
jgi:hypothetical protein